MGEVVSRRRIEARHGMWRSKFLPEEFAPDADRVARFQREAKLLASLIHPTSAAIHGLEDPAEQLPWCLELVQGETLAEQLKRGPIPVEDALSWRFRSPTALERRTKKASYHRDLEAREYQGYARRKVKVLDFSGLARRTRATDKR